MIKTFFKMVFVFAVVCAALAWAAFKIVELLITILHAAISR